MNKVCVAGTEINNISLRMAIETIATFIAERTPQYVVTPNVDHIVSLQDDQQFKEVYRNAALVLCDSMPLLWASRILGTPLKEKISGSDLFPRVCEIASKRGWRLFFLGGREGAAAKAAVILQERYPGLQVVGTYCPPFGFEHDEKENRKIVEMIKATKLDIIFVGLGAPKQEKWIYQYKDQYQVPVSIGIGASFEFVSGMVKRAPVWMQKVGLEWFWRLMMEPRRLWRRYLLRDISFLGLLMRQKFSHEGERGT